MIRESNIPIQRKMDNPIREIQSNYQNILERISQAATSVGRKPEQVRLMVVTKGQPLEIVQAALATGARLLGENYVEEALGKMQAFSGEIGIEWHMIGHVQSRKAELACRHFSCIHSVDSLKLANRLNRFANDQDRKLPILLECNVSQEESKFGWKAWDDNRWEVLAQEITPLLELPALEVRGLMTIPPLLPNPEDSRPYFQKLQKLQTWFQERFPDISWEELSMGMSGDFEVAVQEGATIVRIGTAILGERIG